MTANNSHALLEVWTWKEQACQEVADLPIEQALKKRLDDSLKTVQQLGLTVSIKRTESDARQTTAYQVMVT